MLKASNTGIFSYEIYLKIWNLPLNMEFTIKMVCVGELQRYEYLSCSEFLFRLLNDNMTVSFRKKVIPLSCTHIYRFLGDSEPKIFQLR